MNELIKTRENENGHIVVSGRELHSFLGVKTQYTKWMERMLEYGFIENVDFSTLSQKRLTAQGNSTTYIDHALTLDMAKELSMIQRNEKGKEARQYFLQVEKFWNSPEMIMKRALEIADKKIESLKLENEQMKPKALFADAVDASKTSILVGDLAKLISQNGVRIGQNRLFQWLRDNGYLISRKGESFNMPTQRSMEMKLIEIKERTHNNPDGSIRISKTPKITGKGQVYFVNKFLENSTG